MDERRLDAGADDATPGADGARALPRVEFMRIRQAIRSARVVYAVSALAFLFAAIGLAGSPEAGYVSLAAFPAALSVAHAIGWLRAVRMPLVWPRRMALLLSAEFGVGMTAIVVQHLQGVTGGWRPDQVVLAVGMLLLAWDGVPRGEDAELLENGSDDWPKYLQRYHSRPWRRRS